MVLLLKIALLALIATLGLAAHIAYREYPSLRADSAAAVLVLVGVLVVLYLVIGQAFG